MSEKKKNKLLVLLPFVLSAGFLGWFFYTIDYKKIWESVKNADVTYLLIAGIFYFLINFIIWFRWMMLMNALNLKFKWFDSLRWFFMGLLCSFLPLSSVGGDMIKGVGLAQITGNKTKVFASIVLDRLIGFVGIVLLAFVAFWGGRHIVDNPKILVAIFTLTTLLIVMGVVLFSFRVFSWSTKVFARWPRLKNALMELHHDLVLLKGKQGQAIIALVLSVIAQIALAVDYYLIAKALHQEIPLFYFIIFSPLICVATSIPSIGGLGIRELGWAKLLQQVGFSGFIGGALGWINFFFMIVTGIIGGLLYVITLSPRRVQHPKSSGAFASGNA